MIVYKITNLVNGKEYVGVTTRSLKERFVQHKSNARNGRSTYLCTAMRHYGCECFVIEELAQASSKEELSRLEREFVAELNTLAPHGYNTHKGGVRRWERMAEEEGGEEGESRLYNIWSGIRDRCLNRNNSDYPDYGGRGITICEEWSNNFETFRDWALDNRYRDGLTIDRIYNNASYSPENCRWITMKEQARNKRNNVLLEIGGVTKCLKEWAEVFHINYGTFGWRYRKGLRGIKLVQGGKI